MNAFSDSSKTQVFLCYRQVDGREIADQIYELLQGATIPGGSALDIYYDRTTPAVSDWTAIHLSSLHSAHAMILIATPAACYRTPKQDWVHLELDWWIANRGTPPIVVNPMKDDDRWIPPQVNDRWPNCQRVNIECDANGQFAYTDRVLQQIVDGIRISETRYLFEELETQRRLRQRLTFATVTSVAASLCTVGVLAYALYTSSQMIGRLRAVEADASQLLKKLTLVERGIVETVTSQQEIANEIDGRFQELDRRIKTLERHSKEADK